MLIVLPFSQPAMEIQLKTWSAHICQGESKRVEMTLSGRQGKHGQTVV